MKRKNKKLLTLILMSTLTMSCGGSKAKSEKTVVFPISTEIGGELSSYIEIEDGEYEVIEDWGGDISIRLKAKQSIPEEMLEGKEVELFLNLLDENKMPVSGTDQFEIDYSSKSKLESLMLSGTGTTIIKMKTLLGGYEEENHAEDSKFFEMSSLIKDKPVYGKQNDNNQPSSKSFSNSGSDEYDKMLDDYEEYVDEYVKIMKQANVGDMDLDDLDRLERKTNKLIKSLEKAQKSNNLSSKQAKRMIKIQTKMLDVI